MTKQDYDNKKKVILNHKDLTDRDKDVLITELRHQYFGIDRSEFGHMDSYTFKPAIIKVM